MLHTSQLCRAEFSRPHSFIAHTSPFSLRFLHHHTFLHSCTHHPRRTEYLNCTQDILPCRPAPLMTPFHRNPLLYNNTSTFRTPHSASLLNTIVHSRLRRLTLPLNCTTTFVCLYTEPPASLFILFPRYYSSVSYAVQCTPPNTCSYNSHTFFSSSPSPLPALYIVRV